MHQEILNKDQKDLLPLVKEFRREFCLVGGTAIALQIGHRRSVDFDLFKTAPLKPARIISKISASGYSYNVTRRVDDQLNVTINKVTFTFFQYPFKINCRIKYEGLRMPDLLTLAAMKAYALGRRSKWKDYVDLYFITKYHHKLEEIIKKAEEIFGQLFSEKLFRAQLCYFEDIDMSEAVEFPGPDVPAEEIKKHLINVSTDIL